MDQKQKKGLFGCLGCFGIIFIGIIIISIFALSEVFSPEELTAEEQSIVDGIISDFNAKTPAYIQASDGIVKSIKIFDVEDSDTYAVEVDFAESKWVLLNESEKGSVVAMIGKAMQNMAGETKVYTTLYSAEVGDELARPKFTSSGYEIVR